MSKSKVIFSCLYLLLIYDVWNTASLHIWYMMYENTASECFYFTSVSHDQLMVLHWLCLSKRLVETGSVSTKLLKMSCTSCSEMKGIVHPKPKILSKRKWSSLSVYHLCNFINSHLGLFVWDHAHENMVCFLPLWGRSNGTIASVNNPDQRVSERDRERGSSP